MKITQVGELRLKLGEGPVWDVAEQALYFTDILDQRIWRLDPATGATRSWRFDAKVSAFALREGGGAIVALAKGVHLFDFDTGALKLVGDPEPDDPVTQLNDGKADPAGRFLVGSVASDFKGSDCGLYSVEGGAIRKLDGGFGLTNGPCWSPDGRTFYFADSRPMEIYAYDYDVATGQVSNRRLFASTAALGGIPDGATVDSEGRVYSAICNGGVIACWDPDGRLVRTIEAPSRLVTSVMFGGPDLDRLYVTSIDGSHLPFLPPDAPKDPADGRLFMIEGLGVSGLPERRFRG